MPAYKQSELDFCDMHVYARIVPCVFFFCLVASTSLGIVLSKLWKFSSSCPCIVGSIHYMVNDLDPTVDVEYFSFCEALCLWNACIHLAGNHIYMLPWAVPFSFLFFYLLFFYAKHMLHLHCLLADNNLSRGRSAKTLSFESFKRIIGVTNSLTSLYAPSPSHLCDFPSFSHVVLTRTPPVSGETAAS